MKNQLKIKEVKTDETSIQFDFFIDDKQLSELLNIDRFDIKYSSFDLDLFKVDKLKFPNYNRKEIINNKVSVLLGEKEPENQFDSNRIVLYRCHCGSDYCGIVSFQLRKEEGLVIWKDIRYEDDLDNDNSEIIEREINPIIELKFDNIEYESEFKEYIKKLDTTQINNN